MKRLCFSTILTSLVIAIAFATISVVLPSRANALSGSDFNAGRIMDDGIFFNGNTLGYDTIQQFLNSKVPVCDTNGTQPRGGTTRGAYGASVGNPPPYICLKDYTQNTPAKAADAYCPGGLGGGMKSSASIIYEVARACNINPKVLLVLLQKEQSLITDDWPWPIQYRSATGYGCPDTAPCDAEYYGFFNQVYNAARQFQRYRVQANLFNYRVGVSSYVQYNPNAGCGGTNVYMQTQATAALYNYTPYQPNGPALSNLYGTGDGCSAYGNRNFWRMYNDWFGSTYAESYRWSTSGYSIYNEDKSYTVDPGRLEPGKKYFARISAVNTGAAIWTNTGYNPVMLGAGGDSRFCTAGWFACNRPALLQQASVSPGQTGTFEFPFYAPYTPGEYRESFKPVAEMLSWFNDDVNASFGIRVESPGSFSWNTTGYTIQNVAKSQYMDPGNLEPGQHYVAQISGVNTGTATWKNNGPIPVMLGLARGDSGFCVPVKWHACNRPAKLTQASVAPGQTGTFEFEFVAPRAPGTYYDHFSPVAEMFSWFNTDPDSLFGIRVASPGTFSWSTNGYRIMNQARNQDMDPGRLQRNTVYAVTLTVTNTGTATWKNNGLLPVTLAAPSNTSALCTENWYARCNRLVLLKEASVAPGQTGTFEFEFRTPIALGPYRQDFKPVAEMFSWFNDHPNQTFGIWTY